VLFGVLDYYVIQALQAKSMKSLWDPLFEHLILDGEIAEKFKAFSYLKSL
jgi:hypothetical protein